MGLISNIVDGEYGVSILSKWNSVISLVTDRLKNGNAKGYRVIPSNFDFTNIPAGYDNSIWDIRYEHDLLNGTITLPLNVKLIGGGGKLYNFNLLTGSNTSYECDYELFGSGSFSGTWDMYNINAKNFDDNSLLSFVNNMLTPIHLRLKSKTYTYPTSILLPTNSIIEGEGIGKTIIKKQDYTASNQPLITNKTGSSNIIVKRLSLNGNSSNQTATPLLTRNSGVYVNNCDNSIVEEVETYDCSYSDFAGGGDSSIQIFNSANCKVEKCIAHNNLFNGIGSYGGVNCYINSNKSYSNRVTGIGTSKGAHYCTVSNNKVYDNGSAYNQISINATFQIVFGNNVYMTSGITGGGINLAHTGAIEAGDNSLIYGNEVSNANSGIAVGNSSNINIFNNTVHDCTDGIRAVDDTFNITINGNSIYTISDSGIQIGGVSDFHVSNNKVLNCDNYGIFATNISDSIKIIGNSIVDDRISPNMLYCVNIDGAKVDNVYVSGNIFEGYVTSPWRSPSQSLTGLNMDQGDLNTLTTSIHLYAPWFSPKYKKITAVSSGVLQYDSKNLQFTLSGNTGNRPSGAHILLGQSYFDTTLGIPIWWNGSVWKNSTGGIV